MLGKYEFLCQICLQFVGCGTMDMLAIAKSVKVKVRFTNLGIYMSIYLLTSVNLLNNFIISLDYMLAISSGP